MAFHARYVILDAQGLVVHPEPRQSKKSGAAEEDSEGDVKLVQTGSNRWRAIDPPHAPPQPAYQRPAPQPAAAGDANGIVDANTWKVRTAAGALNRIDVTPADTTVSLQGAFERRSMWSRSTTV